MKILSEMEKVNVGYGQCGRRTMWKDSVEEGVWKKDSVEEGQC